MADTLLITAYTLPVRPRSSPSSSSSALHSRSCLRDNQEDMASKSKILVIGGTGFVGKYMVEASAKAAHPTFALVRDSTLTDPSKSHIIDNFKRLGVNFLPGDVLDHESLVKAVKEVDVVISTVSVKLFKEQTKIISAIKEAGNIKKFYPSEFGNDADRSHAVGPAKATFDTKAQIRRAIEAEGVPFTHVVSHFFFSAFLNSFGMPGATSPPRDKVVIVGDGNTKEAPRPRNVMLSLAHSAFLTGDHVNFEIEPSFGVEASALYPDIKYTTVDEYLDQFV
ncbi:hypothetical protein Ancab_027420 [Ancistrocladus abbreviatus]